MCCIYDSRANGINILAEVNVLMNRHLGNLHTKEHFNLKTNFQCYLVVRVKSLPSIVLAFQMFLFIGRKGKTVFFSFFVQLQ